MKADIKKVNSLKSELKSAMLETILPPKRIMWSKAREGRNPVNGLPILMIPYRGNRGDYVHWYTFLASKTALHLHEIANHNVARKYFNK